MALIYKTVKRYVHMRAIFQGHSLRMLINGSLEMYPRYPTLLQTSFEASVTITKHFLQIT